VNEGIVEGGEDVSNAEDEFAFADLRTEGDSILNGGSLLGSALRLNAYKEKNKLRFSTVG
jgi:hypothetical protein